MLSRGRRNHALRARFALAAAITLAHSVALAQGTDELGSYGDERSHNHESQPSWAVELRAGAYPLSFDDRTPYGDLFGDREPLLLGLEFDAQLVRIPYVGSIGPGFGWGFASTSTKTWSTRGTARAEKETTFSLMPMYAVGVLRIDVLAREARTPLVPYVKGGVGYAFWWVSEGNETAEQEGVGGRGGSYGGQYALGIMLLLDALDEVSARQIDNTSGVDNSYLFVERYVSYLDGFGAGSRMRVGTASWFFGIALEG